MRPTRPPDGFVLITRTRWLELSRALRARPRAFQLEREGVVIGWRNSCAHFVSPNGYRDSLGTWPDGYWPDAP